MGNVVPGRRQNNQKGRIARTRPPGRDQVGMAALAIEYDLQNILSEDDVRRIVKKVLEESTGGGGVNDVNLTMPGEYDVVKSTPAAVINFVVTWLNENANKIFAGPASGTPGVPTFRDQVNLDLPARSRISIVNTAFGATVTPDASAGSQFALLANSNFTLNAPTGMLDGQKITIRITQDGTGGRIMTLSSAYRYSTFLTPAFVQLTPTPNATDYLGVEWNNDAGKFDIISFVPGVH